MKRLIQEMRALHEAPEDNLYVDPPLGMARFVAMTTPGVTRNDSDYQAADKSIQHMKVLIRRRSLLAKAYRLIRHRSRAFQSVLALRRKLDSAA